MNRRALDRLSSSTHIDNDDDDDDEDKGGDGDGDDEGKCSDGSVVVDDGCCRCNA